jgi:polyphosphate kinase
MTGPKRAKARIKGKKPQDAAIVLQPMAEKAYPVPAKPDEALEDPSLYFNRELNWIEFNRRVLEEALDPSVPLLERVRFLAIFSTNLDEFFMIRVAGLLRQLNLGVLEAPPDRMTPTEQLVRVRKALKPILALQLEAWKKDVHPRLFAEGIRIHHYEDLEAGARKLLNAYFREEIFPTLTPLAFDAGHPFPHISSLSLNLAVTLKGPKGVERFARVKIPTIFPRLLRVPDEGRGNRFNRMGMTDPLNNDFVWIEEVVAANLDLLFPGLPVTSAHPFRVIRDADFEIEDDEAPDLLTVMEENVEQRQFGVPVCLAFDKAMPAKVKRVLIENLRVGPCQVYSVEGPLGMGDLMELFSLDRPPLKEAPFAPSLPEALHKSPDVFAAIRKRDILLFHPYDSFRPVVDFLSAAARDPDVLAIKQTLYRVGKNAPIVEALLEARESGKQVMAMVELKARFDEENNIQWARELERAGVHVVYGVLGLKCHAKALLVVRREEGGIRRYVHLGTGNYNAVTARQYTDLGLFTCDPDIGEDVVDVFNAISGYSIKRDYRKLLVAPANMREGILSRIDREVALHERQGGGHLVFKLNALVDKACIQALYRASRGGVRVDLQVRGICCLRPQVKGLSENIRVTSIVGRFLEHPRIFWFRNGGNEEILLGSADLMPRNLERRVEILFPVSDPGLASAVRDSILNVHLEDTVKTRLLMQDGTYVRVRPQAGVPARNAQREMIEGRGSWNDG